MVNDTDGLRALYLQQRDGRRSPTRLNIERLVGMLRAAGAGTVLETNVWTLPTQASLRWDEPTPRASLVPRYSWSC